ncbi:potassium transporter Trk [Microbacterium telephonicum]|uniref:Potassium transporter Trk n=1 Tax=Microbacterium telephonicum TaxID=1714841 RepID=A0A498CAW7_9MICO|nr:potassium transporter Trk [Microbacterium telephonicum]RLK52319.1 hypothetical protein C7474_0253 [Microbacterium telephonicum]
MTDPAEHRIEKAQLRRAPKYGVFLALGAALGIIAALILTFAFAGGQDATDESPFTGVTYTTTQVFGFVALICIPVGLALGGVVALILDRTVGRRTREVTVDHERHVEPPVGDED